ncbi:hypothetical protein BDP27DRAFT_1469189 [Rhodocollybia butyracea]|uniref:Uncharacterized protein n=1 Tax=Rhodocollybia butyracea TaxID=206335 RepID=A0A9P5PJS6_9AGAR|nr:hypothetical protein BDP27DRAFT_1469189 [Rhodocollybia butyracea]
MYGVVYFRYYNTSMVLCLSVVLAVQVIYLYKVILVYPFFRMCIMAVFYLFNLTTNSSLSDVHDRLELMLSSLESTQTQRRIIIDPSRKLLALTDVPVFIGYMLSYLLQGILFVQMLLLIFIVELASTVVATVAILQSILFEGQLSASLTVSARTFSCISVLSGLGYYLAATMVQGSYAWRIHVLGGRWKVTVPIMVLSIIQCVMLSYWGSVTWLCKRIRRTQSQPLIARVKRAMTIAIDTGVLTVLGASIQLLLYLSLPGIALWHLAIFFPLPKLLMATLNARIIVKAGRFSNNTAEVAEKRASNIEAWMHNHYTHHASLARTGTHPAPLPCTLARTMHAPRITCTHPQNDDGRQPPMCLVQCTIQVAALGTEVKERLKKG